MKLMVKNLKTIDESSNRSVRRQKISFIVSFLTPNATALNSYGLISTVLFHYCLLYTSDAADE